MLFIARFYSQTISVNNTNKFCSENNCKYIARVCVLKNVVWESAVLSIKII